MPQVIRKSDLSDEEQQLVELLQDIDFGRVEELNIRDGKPVFQPPPRAIATLKMQAEQRNRDGTRLRDFSLKQSVVLLLLLMRQIGDGKILLIEVRHGLPVTVEIERLRNR
jgi:hypothetical protein